MLIRWLDFALSYNYIDKDLYDELLKASEEVGKLINYMINNPGKFQHTEDCILKTAY